jgi:hypothetical protein
MSGGGARVAYPLFQEEDGGSMPTSPLQFNIYEISLERAVELNKQWHSRLPIMSLNCLRMPPCISFGAEFNGRIYACAIWSAPIARYFVNKGYLELRRMAISADAPKNTASRMISIMVKLIKTKHPNIIKLISYQDTEVHQGIIYKASGWIDASRCKGSNWSCNTRNYKEKENQSKADKIRWEKDLR